MYNEFYIGMLLLGASLVVWTMQLISNRNFLTADEPQWMLHARRVALAAIALGMLWAASFSFERNWEPWAPDFIIVGGIDLYLVLVIVSSSLKLRQLSLQGGRA